MATTYTENFNLGKQENRPDKFDMSVITKNMDIIDETMQELLDNIAEHDANENIHIMSADKEKLAKLENYDDSEVKADIAALANQTAINKATLGYQRKNLLKNALKSQTLSGVTAAVSEDGSVTLNGTATTNIFFDIRVSVALESGKKYIISGCPLGGSTSSYALFVEDAGSTRSWDFGDGAIFTASSSYRVAIRINSGYTADNLTFFPMLRYAEIADDTYEPYKPSIDERLAALEEAIKNGI